MPPPESIELAVIGGGPAGLRAAEIAASAGVSVTLFDAMPSVGRKLLVAGKGGLNLTHGEPADAFASRYQGPDTPDGLWRELLASFDTAALRSWAEGLGVETFQASSGRIYPVTMKAAPLLRRWISRLRALGVRFVTRHKWASLTPGSPHRIGFANGTQVDAWALIFALGGGSWPQTGSDGSWLPVFADLGVHCHPLEPANSGWECDWPNEVLENAEGKPLKNIRVEADGTWVEGELLITRYGLEGGAIYRLGHTLRAMELPRITIDFKPAHTADQLAAKLAGTRRNFLTAARSAWKLGDAAHAILSTRAWSDAATLARAAKRFPLDLTKPRPLAEAISSAGGIRWDEFDANLMLTKLPGIFAAGEMIDWEAPTGGYLIHGCLASATKAASGAVGWLRANT